MGSARLSWKEGRHPDNVADVFVAPDPHKALDLAFAAAGRSYEVIGAEPGSLPERELRERIIASTRRAITTSPLRCASSRRRRCRSCGSSSVGMGIR